MLNVAIDDIYVATNLVTDPIITGLRLFYDNSESVELSLYYSLI